MMSGFWEAPVRDSLGKHIGVLVNWHWKNSSVVALDSVHGVNTPAVANVKPSMWCHWKWSWKGQITISSHERVPAGLQHGIGKTSRFLEQGHATVSRELFTKQQPHSLYWAVLGSEHLTVKEQRTIVRELPIVSWGGVHEAVEAQENYVERWRGAFRSGPKLIQKAQVNKLPRPPFT